MESDISHDEDRMQRILEEESMPMIKQIFSNFSTFDEMTDENYMTYPSNVVI